MATRQLEAERVATDLEDPAVSINRQLNQGLLEEGIEVLRADLVVLQTEQERGLGSLSATLDRIGQDVGSVRIQLAALAEPLLTAQVGADTAAGEPGSESGSLSFEAQLRLERLESQVTLLVRSMEAVDGLRYQSDVHTRALARLTDVLSEVVRPKPDGALESVKQALNNLEESQRGTGRRLVFALALLAVGVAPGLAALAWLVINSVGLL